MCFVFCNCAPMYDTKSTDYGHYPFTFMIHMAGDDYTNGMNEWMKNLYTLLSRKTDPKARKPNKMTSSATNKKIIIGDDPIQYPRMVLWPWTRTVIYGILFIEIHEKILDWQVHRLCWGIHIPGSYHFCIKLSVWSGKLTFFK